jgi:hypothetical protein
MMEVVQVKAGEEACALAKRFSVTSNNEFVV